MSNPLCRISLAWTAGLLATTILLVSCESQEATPTIKAVPAAYAKKHMPEGWWIDPLILEEGGTIYLGREKAGVNCANCHGKDGRPVRAGARNFQDTAGMKTLSDSYLLWRIAEGVPHRGMPGYQSQLTENQIWKLIAYLSTLGLKGLYYDTDAGKWIPIDRAGVHSIGDGILKNQQGS